MSGVAVPVHAFTADQLDLEVDANGRVRLWRVMIGADGSVTATEYERRPNDWAWTDDDTCEPPLS